jgi:hypothetical protein
MKRNDFDDKSHLTIMGKDYLLVYSLNTVFCFLSPGICDVIWHYLDDAYSWANILGLQIEYSRKQKINFLAITFERKDIK